jgi:hypothetical protein
VEKAFCVAAHIGHIGQTVGPRCITVGVRQLVDDTVGAGRGDHPAAGIGFDVAVQVERDVAFGVVVGVGPDRAVVRPVVGGSEAVGIIVGEAVLLPGKTGAAEIGSPLHGGDVAVVLRGGAVGVAFIIEAHAEYIGDRLTCLLKHAYQLPFRAIIYKFKFFPILIDHCNVIFILFKSSLEFNYRYVKNSISVPQRNNPEKFNYLMLFKQFFIYLHLFNSNPIYYRRKVLSR